MAYGKVKADAFIYDDGGDQEVSLSALAAKASLASPTFTGTPAAPTAAQGTNTTQIATTEFVNAEIAADITGKADLASPTFTGTPLAPTAAQGTNTTQLATTEFVNAEIAADLTAAIGSTVQAHDADTAKTDVAQTLTAAQRADISAITFNATMTPDFSLANNFSVTLTGTARIANPTNQVAGQSGSIFLTQDGTGSHVVSWGDSGGTSAWYWAGGTAPTLSTGANVKDRVDYIVAASGVIHAVATLAVSANTP